AGPATITGGNVVTAAQSPLGLIEVRASSPGDSLYAPAEAIQQIQTFDATKPVIAAHGAVTAEATSAAGAIVTYTAPATLDHIDAAGAAPCARASGSQFALGSTPVTCSAADAAGNDAVSTTFTVAVSDTKPPVVDAHADVTAEATSASGAAVTYTAPA